ncbi:MAG: hypothetical protein R2695_05485 [Acidimicrobiales bacterium]
MTSTDTPIDLEPGVRLYPDSDSLPGVPLSGPAFNGAKLALLIADLAMIAPRTVQEPGSTIGSIPAIRPTRSAICC